MNSLSKWIAAALVGGSLVAGACFAAEPIDKVPCELKSPLEIHHRRRHLAPLWVPNDGLEAPSWR